MSAAQTGKPVTKRHWELELLRIFSMFLIVATHYFASDDSPSRIDPALAQSWKSALHAVTIMPGQVGVTIFVLISAYFLSRSTRSPLTRVAKIWIQTFIYSCGLWGAYFVLSHLVGSSQYFVNPRSILMSVFPVTFGAYWFISAYVVMVIVAPYINILLDATSARQHGALLCLSLWITFIWHILNPANTWAFTDASYLCTLYLIGALIRRHEDRLPRVRWYFAMAMMTLCAHLHGWYAYNCCFFFPQGTVVLPRKSLHSRYGGVSDPFRDLWRAYFHHDASVHFRPYACFDA